MVFPVFRTVKLYNPNDLDQALYNLCAVLEFFFTCRAVPFFGRGWDEEKGFLVYVNIYCKRRSRVSIKQCVFGA